MYTQLFCGKASIYEKGRPNISREALDYLFSIIPTNAVFADVGAGTGKFTSLIAKRGNFIYAVEPNDEMRTILTNKLNKYRNVKILGTCAEKTGISDQSVDVIVAATSLHWFDLSAFKLECSRILKSGGIIVAIYNPLKTELRKVTKVYKDNIATDYLCKMGCKIIEFPNSLYYPRDRFIAYYLSHSSSPSPNDIEFTSALRELNLKFDLYKIDDYYLFDFVTVMYICENFTE